MKENGLWSRLFGRSEEPKRSSGPISDFEIITLHESGMRFDHEYEILPKGELAEVSLYACLHGPERGNRRLEKRATCDMRSFLKLINDCKMLSWDGFDGPHPKGVRDGIMFHLSGTVNGGEQIYARGSQNFPRHYRDFKDGLYEILKDAKDVPGEE